MAFTLVDPEETARLLTWIDMIDGDPEDWSPEADLALCARSAAALCADQLPPSARPLIKAWDAYARSKPARFNAMFADCQALIPRAVALEGFVESGPDGTPPAVPADHWWWEPLPE